MRLASLALAVALCAGCHHLFQPPESGITGLAGAAKIYTLTNLHPGGRKLYSANFQQPGLIPVCSEVTLLRVSDEWMTFKVNATGTEYVYAEHPASKPEPFPDNLARYFGGACPQAELDALSALDQEGVRLGVAKKGMSQREVILAIGYPPMRDTRTLELPYWRYWNWRWRFLTVAFDDQGVVEDVAY